MKIDRQQLKADLLQTATDVCMMMGNVSVDEVMGRSRLARIAIARHITAWAMVNIRRWSMNMTGWAMRREHAATRHSCNVVEGWLSMPKMYKAENTIISQLAARYGKA